LAVAHIFEKKARNLNLQGRGRHPFRSWPFAGNRAQPRFPRLLETTSATYDKRDTSCTLHHFRNHSNTRRALVRCAKRSWGRYQRDFLLCFWATFCVHEGCVAHSWPTFRSDV